MVKAWRCNTESTCRYLDWSGAGRSFPLWCTQELNGPTCETQYKLLQEFGCYYVTLSTPWITGILPPQPPQCAKWRYCCWLTSVWTTSQHWLLKNSWKLNPEIKLNRKKVTLPAIQLHLGSLTRVFINFPLLLTSFPPLLSHDFSPNSSSFPTILSASHHLSLSHFGFTLCISCSECYKTYLLLFMWWCSRPLVTAPLFFLLLSGLLFGKIYFILLPQQLFFPPGSILLQLYVIIINNTSVYRHLSLQYPNITEGRWRLNRSWEDTQKKKSSASGQSTIVPKQSDFMSLQITASSFASL